MALYENERRRVMNKEHIYVFSRVKLSNLYNEIGISSLNIRKRDK